MLRAFHFIDRSSLGEYLRILFLALLIAGGGTGSLWAQAPDWSFDPTQYEHTLTVTAAVAVDGEPVSDSSAVLAAFVGGDVRGTARPEGDGEPGEALFFLPVYANESGRTVRFRVYHAETDSVRAAERTLTFEPDATYGTPSSPFRLTIGEGETPGVDEWTVEPAAYEQTMTVTASVEVESLERGASDPGDRLAAFVNGEVRGVVSPEPVGDEYVFFLTVYGDPPDANRALSLHYYDAKTDRVFPTREVDLSFATNAVRGTPSDPISLVAVRPVADVEGLLTLGGITPHPLDRSIQVRFAADRNVSVRLVLYDELGRRVRVLYQGPVEREQFYRSPLRIHDLASGTYWLRLIGPRKQITRRVTVVH